jgi:hypothetical protein
MIIANIPSDKYDESTKQFSQSLVIDGKEASRQSIAVGKGKRFNTAVEVQYGFAGTIYSHCEFQSPRKCLFTDCKAYKNNTFKFAAADPGFPRSVTKGKGVTASTPVSKDGGITWTVDEIIIPDSSYGGAGGKSSGGKGAGGKPTSG